MWEYATPPGTAAARAAVSSPPVRLPREPLRHPWLFVLIAVLFALSIPWWSGEGRPAVVLGLPSWVVVSLACCFAVSCLTAYAVLRLWGDDPD